jgi:hypothetical protein
LGKVAEECKSRRMLGKLGYIFDFDILALVRRRGLAAMIGSITSFIRMWISSGSGFYTPPQPLPGL